MSPTHPSPAVRGWRIPGPGGVPIILTPSWALLAVIIVAYFGPRLTTSLPSTQAYFVAFAYAVILLISVLVHEGAHAVAASACGYPVERIVINLFGGHTAYESRGVTPGKSAIVAVVGPLANGALAAACFGLLNLAAGQISWWLLAAAVLTNLLVGAFNLLPGLPLDGGFVLDALVWKATGKRHLGLLVAGWSGRVIVALLLLWAIFWPLSRGTGPAFFVIAWAGLIGAVLWSGASSAIEGARTTRVLEDVDVARLLRPVLTVPGDAALGTVLEHMRGGTHVVVILSPDGQPQGVLASVDDNDVPEVGAGQLLTTPVSALCIRQPDGWVLNGRGHTWTAPEILEVMRSVQTPMVLLRQEQGDSVVLAQDLNLTRG